MRMWMVNPKLMCNQHLLGEHVECHMLAGTLRKGVRVQGYVDKHLIQTASLNERHDALADEMTARGMNHRSPLALLDVEPQGTVSVQASLTEMARRCAACRQRQKEER